MSSSTRTTATRAVQYGAVALGRLTSESRMLPTFLIAGAQRSGTTSMYRALSQHPAVLKAPFHKGVHYFDIGYHRGMAWYRGHFPTGRRAAAVQRATGERPQTFESSPYYLCHPLAGERIARDLPGVRLVVLLRDPVERAYSAHAHEFARGFETEPFERALDLEESRLAGEESRLRSDPHYRSHSHQHQAYLTRGHYVTYLRALERLVGRDRLHVVDSAEFFAAPDRVYPRVLGFLGLPDFGGARFERHNARSRSPMPESLRRRLEDHFLRWDEELAGWWGRRPSWRR
ncbi:MAG: sulfotransferase family protein [Mycobacteriales bacterium]